jgi:hypothetical protein
MSGGLNLDTGSSTPKDKPTSAPTAVNYIRSPWWKTVSCTVGRPAAGDVLGCRDRQNAANDLERPACGRPDPLGGNRLDALVGRVLVKVLKEDGTQHAGCVWRLRCEPLDRQNVEGDRARPTTNRRCITIPRFPAVIVPRSATLTASSNEWSSTSCSILSHSIARLCSRPSARRSPCTVNCSPRSIGVKTYYCLAIVSRSGFFDSVAD